MSLDVIHIDQGNPERQRKRFCCGQSDKQGADEPRSAGDSDCRQVGQVDTGPGKCVINRWDDPPHMSARRDFRDHAAKALVQLILRADDVRENPQITVDDGSRCLVAARFDCEEKSGAGR